jgi:hypothetical protein
MTSPSRLYELLIDQDQLAGPCNLGFVINKTLHKVVTKFAFTKMQDRSIPLPLKILLTSDNYEHEFVFASGNIQIPLKSQFYYIFDADERFPRDKQQTEDDIQDCRALGIAL